MKQGSGRIKFGLVALISAMIHSRTGGQTEKDTAILMAHRRVLLTNGGRAPVPGNILNQRQKRKRIRQMA